MDEASLESLNQTFRETVQRMHRYKDTGFTPGGLTQAESSLVCAVYISKIGGHSIRPGELARYSRSTPGAISQTLKALEEKGILVRKRSESDNRMVFIELTEKGNWLGEEIKQEFDKKMMTMLSFLGEEDVREFLRIMNRMLEFNERYVKEGMAFAEQFQNETLVSREAEEDGACE